MDFKWFSDGNVYRRQMEFEKQESGCKKDVQHSFWPTRKIYHGPWLNIGHKARFPCPRSPGSTDGSPFQHTARNTQHATQSTQCTRIHLHPYQEGPPTQRKSETRHNTCRTQYTAQITQHTGHERRTIHHATRTHPPHTHAHRRCLTPLGPLPSTPSPLFHGWDLEMLV